MRERGPCESESEWWGLMVGEVLREREYGEELQRW